jgi:hypothetical protein
MPVLCFRPTCLAPPQTSFHALLSTYVPTTGGLIIGTFLRLHSADKAAKKVNHTQAHKRPCNQYRHPPSHPAGPAQRALTGGMRRKSRVSESYDRGSLAPARARSPSGPTAVAAVIPLRTAASSVPGYSLAT